MVFMIEVLLLKFNFPPAIPMAKNVFFTEEAKVAMTMKASIIGF